MAEGAGDRARRWLGLSILAAAAAHAIALGGGLLDADRLLLVHNPEIRSFAGAAAMLAHGEPVVRAAGLVVHERSPLGVISTWLGWQWFRASPPAQHALGLAALIAVVIAFTSLMRALRASPAAACVAALALALHPGAADLTGPILGRDALLATWVALFAARRARDDGGWRAIAWTAGASLVAGLLAPGWGMIGLVAAAVVAAPSVRRAAAIAGLVATVAALAIARTELAGGAIGAGAAAVLLAWLPSPTPFVIASIGADATLAAIPFAALAGGAIVAASRVADEADAALLRAAGAAMSAALLASTAASHAGTFVAAPAFAFHLGVVLALAALVRARGAALIAQARPWMLAAFVIPAAVTALRARAWADEDRVLAAVVARDADDPEALLARGRLALRRGDLEGAAPWCLRYGKSSPTTFRADGCIAALATAQGDEGAATRLLQRWAARFDDKRALRQAVLEIAVAQPDPRFGVIFQRATGFNMPHLRPGEQL